MVEGYVTGWMSKGKGSSLEGCHWKSLSQQGHFTVRVSSLKGVIEFISHWNDKSLKEYHIGRTSHWKGVIVEGHLAGLFFHWMDVSLDVFLLEKRFTARVSVQWRP